MEYIILAVFIVILIIKKHLDKTFVNDFLLIMGPYVVIVFVNNVFMVDALGFYALKDDGMKAVLIAECAYAIGSLFASIVGKKYTLRISRREFTKEDEVLTLKVNSASRYAMFVCAIMVASIIGIILLNGFSAVQADDFALLELKGISGHLFISLYAVVPVLFYESVQTKHKFGIISSVLAVMIAFMTFVKYNVILMILAIALYYMLKDRKSYKKVALFCLVLIIVFFLLNYIIIFVVQSAFGSDTFDFLKGHLWMYISSGVLMMNYTVGQGIHYGIYDFVVQSLGALPNMLLTPFTSFRITTDNSYQSVLSQMPVMSMSGERSNALSVLGTLFSNGDNELGFGLIMIVWGFLMGWIIRKTRYKNYDKISLAGVYIIVLNILSFFGNYWLLSMPWEIFVYCLIFEKVFRLKGGVSIKWRD